MLTAPGGMPPGGCAKDTDASTSRPTAADATDVLFMTGENNPSPVRAVDFADVATGPREVNVKITDRLPLEEAPQSRFELPAVDHEASASSSSPNSSFTSSRRT